MRDPAQRDPASSASTGCMSSEHFGQLAWQFKRMSGSSGDPHYVRVTRRWTGKGDARRQVEKTQRVSPWWKELPDGSVIMTLRVGFSAVEIEKGKAGIAVPSRDKVPDVIETAGRRRAGG
jgi:hypothetical protein